MNKTSLYAGLQLVLPGEGAPAHRHSQSALRAVQSAQQHIVAPLDDTETRQLLQLLAKLAQGNNSLSRTPEKMQRHVT
jgi:hypothetical protein